MLTVDQITDHLTRIYGRRRALNQAAATLNLARAVAHLREQFPTAEYAWVQVGPSAYEISATAAEILRVHDATGSVLWDAEEPEADDLEPLTTQDVARIWTGPEEIESPATDALVWAYEASASSIPTYPGHEHPVAGVAPATDTGDDPALLTFSHIAKEAEKAAWL